VSRPAEERIPLSDPETADALADRALSRAGASLAVGSLALAVLSLLFLLLADGALDARSLPQVVVFGIGELGGLAVAAVCFTLPRRPRRQVDAGSLGSGPDAADIAQITVGRLVVGLPVVCGAAAVVLAVTLRPVSTAVLSAAVAMAIASQLAVLAAVQRSGLRKAAIRR
jgi:hypothetical protein